jgi:hypothetical protein
MHFSSQFKNCFGIRQRIKCRIFGKEMLGKEYGRDAEFSLAEAKHCEVKQDCEWAYPQFL